MDGSSLAKHPRVSRDMMIISQWLKSRSPAREGGMRRDGEEETHINLMNIHGEAELPSEVDSRLRVWGAVGERCRQQLFVHSPHA